MLRNNKGFTLIELIAVVTIMAIIALLATPNIITMIDNGKKEKYVSDAKEFISKATYMYKQDKYKTDTNIFEVSGNAHTIKLSKVQGISEMDDPYGYKYILDQSFVKFQETTNQETEIIERKKSIYLVSCKMEKDETTGEEKCDESKKRYIKDDSNNPVSSTELSTDSVKDK